MTTACSLTKNIKDIVTKAKLHQAPGVEASKYYLEGGSLPFGKQLPQNFRFAPSRSADAGSLTQNGIFIFEP
jgi:hypothetical protein